MTGSKEQLVPVEQIDYENAIHTMRSVSADIALFAACVAVGEKHNPNWSGIKAKAEEWVFDLRTALRTPPTPVGESRLAELTAQRDALNAEIKLMEDGIRKAEYDFAMTHQLVRINEARIQEGKPALSMRAFLSGMTEEDE